MDFLVPLLNFFIHPKKLVQIDESKLRHLNEKTAYILFALAEAVVGEDLRTKVPNFVMMIDDYLGYQRRAQRETLNNGLLIVESTIVAIVFGRGLRGFTHLTLDRRRRVLENMRESRVQQFRNLYAAAVNISASAYYASPATWGDIMYDGVSVDHPSILTGPPPPVPWRRNDPRPIEP